MQAILLALVLLISLGINSCSDLKNGYEELVGEKTNQYECSRCGVSFKSIQDSRGAICSDAPVIERRGEDKFRSKAEVDRILNNMRFQNPIYDLNSGEITNLKNIDPRTSIRPIYDLETGLDISSKQRKYLARKLQSYYVIPGNSWDEYPQGQGHNLIRK